jgi:hypothetical protein
MVAVDDLSLRLEIDFGGDPIIDETIDSRWAVLSYPGWICE